MMITEQQYHTREKFVIRSARTEDARELEALRLLIDGESEYLDREPGEGYLSVEAFEELIKRDSREPRNLFLVASLNNRLVGFCRIEGSSLVRLAHRGEFGICLRESAQGLGIGRALMKEALAWADSSLQKVMLNVLATNDKAIALYESFGFVEEGRLRMDKKLRDGRYYDTIMMGRIRGE